MPTRTPVLEITKARQGSRICLEVPQRKLGAVLCAIGAALDGHPWIPYREGKSRTRGRRGGKKYRESGRDHAGAHANERTRSRASGATKRPDLQSGDVVYPKTSPTHNPKSPTNTARPSAARDAQTFARAATERTQERPHNAPTHDQSSRSNTSNGSTAGSSEAPTPTHGNSEALLREIVSEDQIEQVKRIGVLRTILRETERPILAVPRFAIKAPVRPKSDDYGGLFSGTKSAAQYQKDMSVYENQRKRYEAASREAAAANDARAEAVAHNSLIKGDHFVDCTDACACDARHSPVYLATLMAYQDYNRRKSLPEAVKRQRQPRGTGGSPR